MLQGQGTVHCEPTRLSCVTSGGETSLKMGTSAATTALALNTARLSRRTAFDPSVGMNNNSFTPASDPGSFNDEAVTNLTA
jgi:hypothetical protein